MCYSCITPLTITIRITSFLKKMAINTFLATNNFSYRESKSIITISKIVLKIPITLTPKEEDWCWVNPRQLPLEKTEQHVNSVRLCQHRTRSRVFCSPPRSLRVEPTLCVSPVFKQDNRRQTLDHGRHSLLEHQLRFMALWFCPNLLSCLFRFIVLCFREIECVN